MDVVRKIIKDASSKGVGQTYLVQHSAGSGKSNSITWAAYQLIETYPESEDTSGNKGITQPLFDSVMVVTDRRLLDKQIRDNIAGFSEVKNIVAPAYSSKELRDSLEQGKKIIITTIQKFPFIIDGIDVPRVFLEKCLLYPNCTTLVIPPSKVEVNGEVNLLNVEVRPSQRIFDKYLRDLVNEHDAQIIGALSHDFKSIRTAVINAKTEAALRMWKNDCVFKFVPVLALKDEDAKIK